MIDTLHGAKKLEDAGFAPEQAAAIVEIQWKRPSWILRDLERSGFEREQALAVVVIGHGRLHRPAAHNRHR
jgi:hypothetical protein